MLTHLLDTSVYCQRLKPLPVPEVVQRWSSHGNSVLAVSAVCEAELLYGLVKKGSERLWLEYEQFLKDQLTQIPFGYAEAVQYARLREAVRRNGDTVADMDLMIGATAAAHNLIVVTLNPSHFLRMPSLRVEDWSQPA